jgi:hypothetical protein
MNNETLKHWAMDSAYQFKALHKTADIYHYLYRISTIALFVIVVGTLAWPPGEQMSKLWGALALLLSVVLLVFQKDIEKVRDYRKHADSYKNVYDSLQHAADRNDKPLDAAENTIRGLREMNADFPISKLGHWWTQKVIEKEMNLEWLKK